MRLDKFLKVSRLIKRRTVANALCDAGGVTLDGKTAKASTHVAPGQVLVFNLGRRTVTVRIELVPEKAVPAQSAHTLYTVIADVYNNPEQALPRQNVQIGLELDDEFPERQGES